MRIGSILVFVVAFAFAGIAALLVRSALTAPGNEASALAGQPAGMPMKSVVVAVRDLKAGEKLIPDFVREAAWPAELLPKGAFTARQVLFKGGAEPILAIAIAQNEPILAQRLLGGPDNGLAGRLNDGMRGITIRVNEASSVGGFVQPEDRVDVLLTQTERPGEAGVGRTRAYTKTLVKNVRVLAADQQIQRKQQTQPPKTVTLEVSEEDAKRLTLAGTIGQLSLTLNKGENSRAASRTVDLSDVAALQEKEEPAEMTANSPVVSVFRSVERKEYQVPRQ
ncbi:MAG: Flp pilus assembly protein CpaB [Rhodomicrobium sp.]